MTLKEKTISGLTWSFIDNFIGQGINFLVGIILARLLTPKEFGLIGMIAIFIAISQSFVNSGFSQALIRKQNANQTDYSTIFYFNMLVGIFFYLLLFVFAGSIANFFDEPQLKMLVRVLGIGIIINAFTIIQTTTLTKNVNFKLQTKISVISGILSGLIGVALAYSGYGVWSLVWRTIAGYFVTSGLLWFWNRWKPIAVFSIQSLKELFSFGSKLLASGLIDTIYTNVYYLIIGKYFSASDLGYYTRAEMFKNLPSQNIQSVISKVSFPVLSSIQDDKTVLKTAYKKLIKSSMLITFVLMIGMAAVAEPMVITLVGVKWQPCIIYLQMLCFVGMLYPLHALNLNMLQVQGRSDLYLRLEIIKKMLAIPVIAVGIIWGVKIMILGMFVNSLFAYYLNSYYSGGFIGYSMSEQIKDILPSFCLAIFVGSIVFLTGYFMKVMPWIKLSIQIGLGSFLTFGICEILKIPDYIYIKEIVFDKLYKKRKQ